MSNELLWLLFIILQFSLLVIAYKIFGLTGLHVWIGFAIVAANIQVIKMIDLFSISATLGNIMYGSIFLATDLINEKYGVKEAKKAVFIGFFMLFSFTVITQVALKFVPNDVDFAQESLETIFNLLPRITIGSLVAYLVSQTLDVIIFNKIKEKYSSDATLWIRNNGSTLISQAIDTIIFTLIVFTGAVPSTILFSIFWTSYVLKILTSICDTPFVYLMKKINPVGEKNEI